MKAANLRKSILQYAVEGKLIPQDIHDEPASILYDKIIKEKETLIKQGKIKKEKPLPPITDDEIPYDIPENWKWVRLGEVCEIYTGNSINTEVKNKKYTNLKQGYNYIATKDVNFNSIIDYNNGIKIPFDEINFKIAKKNTTLICIEGGSAGRKIGFLNQDVCFGNKLCSINGYLLYNKYLFYFAQSPIFLSIFNEYKAGIIGGVSVNLIKNIILPLPPLKEQERIIKKVDELMALCDKLEQEEEKLSALDKHFADTLPKSILQYAVEGKLVLQNIHDEPASLLYDKIIKEKESLIKQGKIKNEKPLPPITDDEIPYDIPENWKWARLGEVYNYGTCTSFEYHKIPNNTWILELEDIESGTGTINKYIYTPQRKPKSAKNLFNKNDILYSKLRPYLNKVLIANNTGFCSSEIVPIQPNIFINSLYTVLFFKNPFFLNYANKCSYGVKMPRLGTTSAKLALFPLPPLKEQERIVKKVDELLTYCNKLKDII